MIKIVAAKIASHKTDKSPQFLAKVAVFQLRRRHRAALDKAGVVEAFWAGVSSPRRNKRNLISLDYDWPAGDDDWPRGRRKNSEPLPIFPVVPADPPVRPGYAPPARLPLRPMGRRRHSVAPG
jgi:hypothetical protein